MAQQYSSGALLVYVTLGGGQTLPNYLGTCEGPPRIEFDPRFTPVNTDLSGPEIPYDMAFAGMTASVSMVLTRWNNIVASALETMPGPSSTNQPGSWNLTDVGSLVAAEGWAFTVWLRFLFGSGSTSKAAYTSGTGVTGGIGGLPAGYRFRLCTHGGLFNVEAGARPMKRQFVFRAIPFFDGTNPSNPKFTLYDADMSAVSSLSAV